VGVTEVASRFCPPPSTGFAGPLPRFEGEDADC
jgi:hypothetical protein